MSEDKGGEYTKRLSQELKSSLYQRNTAGQGTGAGQGEHQMWNGDMPPPDLQVWVGAARLSSQISGFPSGVFS